MYSLQYLIISFSVSQSIVVSQPSLPEALSQGSFKLDVVRSEGTKTIDKRKGEPKTGKLAATPQPLPQNNHFWITSVTIGTPPQPMNVTVDTGSGNL